MSHISNAAFERIAFRMVIGAMEDQLKADNERMQRIIEQQRESEATYNKALASVLGAFSAFTPPRDVFRATLHHSDGHTEQLTVGDRKDWRNNPIFGGLKPGHYVWASETVVGDTPQEVANEDEVFREAELETFEVDGGRDWYEDVTAVVTVKP